MAARYGSWVLAVASLIVVLAGCLGTQTPETTGESASQEGFAPVEHVQVVSYYAQGPGGSTTDTQNMRDTTWELQVPDGAREARVLAEWDPTTPASREQGVMVHLGTRDELRDPIVEAYSSSPLETEWAAIPPGERTLVVMCHVYSTPAQPAAAEVDQATRFVVEFR